MRWQLEDLKAKGVSGTWYYPRFVYGEPLSSDPQYWTEGWWDFTKFAAEEHRRLGLRGWFSDWTAHRFFQNKVFEDAKKEPSLQGRCLVIHEAESSADKVTQLEIPQNEEILDAAAFRRTAGSLDFASRRDLRDSIRGRRLSWKAGEAGWLVTVVTTRPQYLDYLNRAVAERWLKYSMEVYREKLPGLLGSPVEVFGPDEMEVLDGAILYNPALVSNFRTKKGYDPIPYLVGLFHDIGPKTEKIRCDYYETMVSLLEENWYRPIPQWLHDHGMKYADFCPRGKDNDFLQQTFHYGDYFSKMRHFDRLGSEEHAGRPRAYSFFAKTSSSVIHLYGGDRVGVCCYWLSGWGHNTQENQAWTNENYTYGVNLYNLHGGLYETLGGWYEWVPPEVDYRQPYWKYWKHFTGYITRLSYILSQGVHVSDVAILYPMSTIHAHWSGGNNFGPPAKEAAESSVRLAQELFYRGIDFNFIDYPSVRRAKVRDGKLAVSGLEFRVFLLPPMTTIRTETLEKVKEFYDGGGTVIAFKRLPQASAENGRNDPNILRTRGVAVRRAVQQGPDQGRSSREPARRQGAVRTRRPGSRP